MTHLEVGALIYIEMKELIRIQQVNNQGLVNARELHAFLIKDAKGGQTGRMFAHWIKERIEQYGFIENQDYSIIEYDYKGNIIALNGKSDTQAHKREYGLTLDMCKELCMVENNDKGKEARQYFIAVEKQSLKPAYTIPQNYAEALEFAAKQQRMIESNTKEIARLRPMADFVGRSINSDGLTEMSMAVKVLGLPYGRNKFYALLRKAGVFFKNRNEPLQQYIEMGFFQMKQKIITRKSHPTIVVNVPFMTQKGMLRMSAWLQERGYFDLNKVLNFLSK
jgi:anti-repressor protein